MRALLIAVALVALGAGGYYFYQRSGQTAEAQSAAGAPHGGAPSASDARLQAFSSNCLAWRFEYDATRAAAIEAGWQPIDSESDPELNSVFNQGRGALESGVAGPNGRIEAFSRADAGRALHLILTSGVAQGQSFVGCYIYEFRSTEPVADDVARAVMGSAPTSQNRFPGQFQSLEWSQPPAHPGVVLVRIAYIWPSDEAVREVGYTGVLLSTTTIPRRS
jgi:hypothetical protein